MERNHNHGNSAWRVPWPASESRIDRVKGKLHVGAQQVRDSPPLELIEHIEESNKKGNFKTATQKYPRSGFALAGPGAVNGSGVEARGPRPVAPTLPPR